MKLNVYEWDGKFPKNTWMAPSPFLVIREDGNDIFSARDGEPEDNGLYRNFNDCFYIPKLMEMAYLAGVKGEGFEVVNHKVAEYPD